MFLCNSHQISPSFALTSEDTTLALEQFGAPCGHARGRGIKCLQTRSAPCIVLGGMIRFGTTEHPISSYVVVAVVICKSGAMCPLRNAHISSRQGRFVVGGHVEKGSEPITGVYRLNADLSVEQLSSGVRCSNSICFSPEGGDMFFTDLAGPPRHQSRSEPIQQVRRWVNRPTW